MAASTTLTSALGINDTSVSITSATGFLAGSFLLVDQEWMRVGQSYASGTSVPIIRGINGTATAAHKSGANVWVGTSAEIPAAPPQSPVSVPGPVQRAVMKDSYSASGAIALPIAGTDSRVMLNGVVALAMTLANPTKDMDCDVLTIVGNGKAAHTVTYTAGLGNSGAGADLMTFDVGGQGSLPLIAANGFWVPYSSPLSGIVTAIDIAVT